MTNLEILCTMMELDEKIKDQKRLVSLKKETNNKLKNLIGNSSVMDSLIFENEKNIQLAEIKLKSLELAYLQLEYDLDYKED